MYKLIPVTFLSCLFALISHNMSGYDPINGTYQRKEKLFYFLTAFTLIVFGGLRTTYNDTGSYWFVYLELPKRLPTEGSLFSDIEWLKIGKNPGFEATMRVMIELGFSVQTFTLVFTAFIVGVNIWFFRKYSCHFFFSVFLYITFAGYMFGLAAIKQCTAMSMGLIATDFAIRKKYLRCILVVLAASTFHPYALMYLVLPFMFFRPWSKYTVFMLIVFAIVGVSMESLMGTILNVTDMLGENYDVSNFNREGVNPIRLLVVAVPVGLSLLNKDAVEQHEERDQYAALNLTMLNAEIMFVALFGTANFFGRLANYFLPFQAVSLPWLFKQFHYESKRTITVIACGCYLLFFIYNNGINEHFDTVFYRTNLWDYLGEFVGDFF